MLYGKSQAREAGLALKIIGHKLCQMRRLSVWHAIAIGPFATRQTLMLEMVMHLTYREQLLEAAPQGDACTLHILWAFLELQT